MPASPATRALAGERPLGGADRLLSHAVWWRRCVDAQRVVLSQLLGGL